MAWGGVLALPLKFPCLRFPLTMHGSGEVDSWKPHLANSRCI